MVAKYCFRESATVMVRIIHIITRELYAFHLLDLVYTSSGVGITGFLCSEHMNQYGIRSDKKTQLKCRPFRHRSLDKSSKSN